MGWAEILGSYFCSSKTFLLRISHFRVLDEIRDNFDRFEVFAAGLTYRHVLSSDVVGCADGQGGEGNHFKLRRVDIFRGRAMKDFNWFGGIGTPFNDTSWDRSFRFYKMHIDRDGDRTCCWIRANFVHIIVNFPGSVHPSRHTWEPTLDCFRRKFRQFLNR